MTREQNRDQGSTLIMAIVFITVIAMIIAGALSYSAASLNGASRAYVPSRDRLYASDAAMKAMVAYIATHPSEGRYEGEPCNATHTYGTARDQPVTVQVCPQNTISLTPKGGSSSWGLLTMAIGSEKGLVVSGKGGIQINGNVSVNSAIDVANNSLLSVVGGTVSALGGGCAVDKVLIDGVGVANCTVATAPAVDPVYSTGLTAAPAAAIIGSCNGTSKIASLGPGTWTQTTFDAAIGSCDYVWLQPGVHYLQDINWTIGNKVIGGTPTKGIDGIPTSAIGAGCARSSPGAMLILGGTTSIKLSKSTPSFEVCGMTTTQTVDGKSVPVPIPLFGPTSDIFTPTSGTLTVTTGSPSGSGWSNSAQAKTVDLAVATANVAKGNTSTLTIPGWTGAVPASVTPLAAAVTAVSSRDATVALTVRNADASTACTGTATPLPIGSTVSTTTTAAVTLACTKLLVTPLTLLVAVKAGSSNGTRAVKVDGVKLTYGDPGPTIKAACATCTVLSGSGNANSVWLGGEVYLPRGKISLQLPASSTTLSTLGVVVRVLDLQTTGSTSTLPIIAVDNGSLNPGNVTVTSKVGDVVWTSCRVTYAVNGTTVSPGVVVGCTVPR